MKNAILRTSVLLILIVCFFTISFSQKNISITKKDGSKVSYEIKDIKKMIFLDKKIEISTFNNNSVDYLFSDIVNINFQFFSNTPKTIKKSSLVYIYPNPTKGNVFVECSQVIYRIEVFNLQGVRISNYDFINNNEINLDLNSLEEGVYLIIINTEKGVIVDKVLKSDHMKKY